MAGSKEILKQVPVPATIFTIAGIWAIQALSIAPINKELTKINNPALELASFIALWFLEMGAAGAVIGTVERIREREGNSSAV